MTSRLTVLPKPAPTRRARLAFVVSHPIQYYVPLYQQLARRDDLSIKVFYTWHDGSQETWDQGFQKPIAWDLPLREGYPFEAVTNTAGDPGSHHFWGIRNPNLLARVLAWQPDAVHVSGYAYASHLRLLRALHRRHIPVLFRGDSHLLSPTPTWKRLAKQLALRMIFRYPTVFLDVGLHNRQYYQQYGVDRSRLFHCPHSIDVDRFRAESERFEHEAREWRGRLGLAADDLVVLFVGKLEAKKQPLELMRALAEWPDARLVCVLVGDGHLRPQVEELAARYPQRFRTIGFQNQAAMPVVYRLGDLFVLPSIRWETWGLAVNEAFACSRPALVSDQVGCAPELIRSGVTGNVFRAGDWSDFAGQLQSLTNDRDRLCAMGHAAGELAHGFSSSAAAEAIVGALFRVIGLKTD